MAIAARGGPSGDAAGPDGPALPVEGRRFLIRGTVQGVGFRPWIYRLAQAAGVTGRVLNDAAGVAIDAFGAAPQLARFEALLQTPAPPAARVNAIESTVIPAEYNPSFVIVASRTGADPVMSIPPDLATCDRCAEEIGDRANRRFRYAFTNCTDCGPRFTIARDIPYDRRTTTMRRFVMCAACRREYEDVGDRRFHAQPNACPTCGPQLTLYSPSGEPLLLADAITAAAEAVRNGLIVAVKGIGGFHLACDATSVEAVARLRERKRRDEKPFAVMVADTAAADHVAVIGAAERQLLTSSERPIVLAPVRGVALADNVAPRNHYVGLLLPYSPVHHLLLAEVRRPVVMTSGNLSDEPLAFENEEALQRLGRVADLLLMHDREIENRCDDSVAAVIAGSRVVLRRSRGYVPRPVRVARGFERPVLACGALLKNTFCLGSGDQAWLGPHIGDLENVETYESYVESVRRLERFLQIAPEIVAYDLHPEYLSTAYARSRSEATKIPVQHHHAHVVSAMAEHGLTAARDRVVGIAYDGTGYGPDGTMWGAEILLAGTASVARVATWRPLPLVGGDRAIREPWRVALALVDDAFDGAPPVDLEAWFDDVAAADVRLARGLLRTRVHTPLARGVGRYFDAFAALFLRRSRSHYEGQLALEWDQAACDEAVAAFPYEIRGGDGLLELDLRRSVRAAVAALLASKQSAWISAAFHRTVIDATAELVRRAIRRNANLPVVASGGCFQNRRLAEGLVAALAPEIDVLLHGEVPPGDGGIALGQAVIADAVARNG